MVLGAGRTQDGQVGNQLRCSARLQACSPPRALGHGHTGGRGPRFLHRVHVDHRNAGIAHTQWCPKDGGAHFPAKQLIQAP